MCYTRAKSIKVALASLEKKLSNHTSEACEAFICAVHTYVNVAGTKVDDVRYWMFCQKGQINENLPPKPDSLQQHVKRGNYQVCVWKGEPEGITYYTVIKWIRLENSG